MLQTEDHPIKTIMDLSCLLRRAMEQEMEEFKLSSIQSRILGFLWYKRNHHEKAFQKELESEFKIRRSSVTSVIQGLEKHGLVERRSVSTDARQKELVLTEEGVRVQRQVIELSLIHIYVPMEFSRPCGKNACFRKILSTLKKYGAKRCV